MMIASLDAASCSFRSISEFKNISLAIRSRFDTLQLRHASTKFHS
jgi:hypothetical protein